MIKITQLAILITLILNSCINTQKEDNDRGFIVRVGNVAPNFETTLADGTPFKLSDYKGRIVMLQFTASWCSVCRKEMPFIENEIWQQLKDKDFIIVGIDKDEPIEKVKEFAQQTNISYQLALDGYFGLMVPHFSVKQCHFERCYNYTKN